MSFQTKVEKVLPKGKQNMHLIGYVANGVNSAEYMKSSQISSDDGGIDRREIMRILLSKHPAQTEILLHAVSDIGLQESESF
ncbi:hypothetical protein F938_00443 [Acinetobacter bereziniae LMG 1003 = CIP 70.12]|uniref:Uncharacterized protein n=1 Tax=Acinetobacter bereziniae LMG 1003 = CIP 70.12 TaxID=981324 RepID=N9DSK5_ACIBZ|nr:hypothetical protein [Acinetobacter bereziniae]ENW00927.1 hypothetical protein F938_00443 [Acinetobacter bereziniae LMG 1003 = CIP 70.12]